MLTETKKGFGPEILGKRVSHAKFGLVKPGFLEVQLVVSAVEESIRQESEKNVTPAVTAAVAQLEDDVLELLIQDEFRG